jgi:hypothetical protein
MQYQRGSIKQLQNHPHSLWGSPSQSPYFSIGVFLFWRFFAVAFLLFFTWNAVLFYRKFGVFGILYHIFMEVFKNQSIDFPFIWDEVTDFIRHNLLAIVENPNLVVIPL